MKHWTLILGFVAFWLTQQASASLFTLASAVDNGSQTCYQQNVGETGPVNAGVDCDLTSGATGSNTTVSAEADFGTLRAKIDSQNFGLAVPVYCTEGSTCEARYNRGEARAVWADDLTIGSDPGNGPSPATRYYQVVMALSGQMNLSSSLGGAEAVLGTISVILGNYSDDINTYDYFEFEHNGFGMRDFNEHLETKLLPYTPGFAFPFTARLDLRVSYSTLGTGLVVALNDFSNTLELIGFRLFDENGNPLSNGLITSEFGTNIPILPASPSEVPLPPAVWLFSAGLVFLRLAGGASFPTPDKFNAG